MKHALIISLLFGCKQSDSSPGQEADRWPIDPNTGLRIASIPPLPILEEWEDNQSTEERRRLGQAVFNDPRLSGSGLTACTTCHLPQAEAFHSANVVDLPDRSWPEAGPALARNTPSLINQVYADTFHWDGRPADRYEVWVMPFGEPQMNLTDIPYGDVWTTDDPTAQIQLKERFTQTAPGYIDWFMDAYDVDIREESPEAIWELTGKAIAIYMRNVVSRNAPFDRWNEGDDEAMGAQAIRGAELFIGKAGCINCHYGPLLSDFQYHNLSRLQYDDSGEVVDPGRARITGESEDLGKFLTPMLRSVSKGSPFLHDGSIAGLKDVVRHLTNGDAQIDPNHSPLLDFVSPLSEDELDDVVAFLVALNGEPIPREHLTLSPELP